MTKKVNLYRKLTGLELHEIIRRLTKMDRSMVEDVFTYHPPDEAQIESMKRLRKLAMELANAIFEECPHCADRSTALRKLREVVMTANASIVLKGLV